MQLFKLCVRPAVRPLSCYKSAEENPFAIQCGNFKKLWKFDFSDRYWIYILQTAMRQFFLRIYIDFCKTCMRAMSRLGQLFPFASLRLLLYKLDYPPF